MSKQEKTPSIDAEFSDIEIVEEPENDNQLKKKAFNIYCRLANNDETPLEELNDFIKLTDLNLRDFERVKHQVCPNSKCQKTLESFENIYHIPELHIVYCDYCRDEVFSENIQSDRCHIKTCQNKPLKQFQYCANHKCNENDCGEIVYTNTSKCWNHFTKRR